MGRYFLLFLVSLPVSAAAVCADFYHVHRDVVGGLVDHEFIGIAVESNGRFETIEALGLTKGDTDREHFGRIVLGQESARGADLIGSSCHEATIRRARAAAREITGRLQRKHENLAYYVGRMVVTPVAGKPCGNAADEIERAILDILRGA